MTGLYQRLDTWLRDRSRTKFALIIGIVGFTTSFGIGILFNELAFIQAVGMGIGLEGVYYFFDPQ